MFTVTLRFGVNNYMEQWMVVCHSADTCCSQCSCAAVTINRTDLALTSVAQSAIMCHSCQVLTISGYVPPCCMSYFSTTSLRITKQHKQRSCTTTFTAKQRCGIARAERDGTRAETRFRLSLKRTSPFTSVGVSVQSTAGSRGVRISLSNAGYTTFGCGVRVLATHSIRQFPLHFPSRASPCATRFRTSYTDIGVQSVCRCRCLYKWTATWHWH